MTPAVNWILAIVLALVIAALGCYLSARLLPAELPRLLGQIFSVLAAFGSVPAWRKLSG